ncbi:sialidase family protein [Streptomyces sp. HSW2009]|uniref:sialidase family protein n=1 Tax=Streptomyces sp. HSW2009 TaxID=3142890 RepID=UPI0032EE31C6
MARGMTVHQAYGESVPFRSGVGGYASYRIPAAVVTDAGTVLAFAEGRVASASDAGDIDLVLRRSTDGGRSWGPLQVVSRNAEGTAGNPAPVVGAAGRIVLLQVHSAADATEERIRRGQVTPADGRRVWVQHSDDDGKTWSAPREITREAKRPEWLWYATGPGHGVRLRHGAHAGRLVVPANHSLPLPAREHGSADGTENDARAGGTGEGPYDGGHALLSDDGGQSWRIGYVDDNPDGYVNVNETTVAELPDGRLYFNARSDGRAPGTRADAHSADGGASLVRPFRPQAGLTGPVVQASTLHLPPAGPYPAGLLLFAGPAHPGARALMTVRASRDGGRTWRPAHTVDGLPAAYSDLVHLDAETVGLFYETGDFSAYSTLTFRRIPVEDLA